jgi:hypothetical protein
VLAARLSEELTRGERVVACLPFAAVPKLPGRVKRRDKVRVGVRQSWRRYRPLAFTDRRLIVFDSGRTPHARQVIATYPLEQVTLRLVGPGSFGGRDLVLRLPGEGDVPFELGRKDLADLAAALTLLVPPAAIDDAPGQP